MRFEFFLYGIAGCLGVMTSTISSAQAPVTTPATVPATALASAAGGAIDRDPFARYTAPAQCKQAGLRLRAQYWRDKRPDTVRYTPETDSIPASVLYAVRQCVARFSVATVPVDQLVELAAAYLWAGQENLARTAMERLRTANASLPVSVQGWSQYLFVMELVNVPPARLASIATAVRQLDAYGAPAATWRLWAHKEWASQLFMMDDLPKAELEAHAALAASRQMSLVDRIDWVGSIVEAYVVLTKPVALTHGGPAALSILDTAVSDLLPLRQGGDQYVLRGDIDRHRAIPSALGKRDLPLVHGDVWYGAGGDTVRPHRGVPTLLCFVQSPDAGDYPFFAVLQRLHESYGDRLDIVLMSSTEGHFRQQLMTSAKTEADLTGDYYTRFIHLPATLAVEITPFRYGRDGRRKNLPVLNRERFALGASSILLDASGSVRWVGGGFPYDERVLNGVIASIIK